MFDLFWKLDGYLVIPHELLHVLANRLIGKRCAYRFGEHKVMALEDRTFNQRLFCLLFPLFINGLTVLLLLGIWFVTYLTESYPLNPFAYLQTAPLWHLILFFSWVGLMTYAGTCLWDVIFAGRLLAEKLRQCPPHQTEKDQDDRKYPQER